MGKLDRLRKENNYREGNISPSNQEKYREILSKLRAIPLNEYHQEQIREDIIELIWQAQLRNESIETIVDGDATDFVSLISESVPRQTKMEKHIIDVAIFLNAAQSSILLFLVLKLMEFTTFSLITVNILEMLYYFIIFPIIALKSVEYLIEKEWKIKNIGLTSVIGGIVCSPLIIHKVILKEFIGNVSLPIWMIFIFFILVAVVRYILEQKINHYYYTEL